MSNWVTLTGRDIRLMDAERSIMDNATPVQSLDTCVASDERAREIKSASTPLSSSVARDGAAAQIHRTATIRRKKPGITGVIAGDLCVN